ncbi:hypothetical protein DFR52_10470 [Hoeflea marina]|uniref:Secreted protein n=1 Tax=Hoeflea marina TaxID=274592 RepID=A0A317PF19_9HYPH|nr:hypothetical protein [Hoeflea marina]PWV98781.1 hypothetical protein DFR52_10470 [Hoeflea marina]
MDRRHFLLAALGLPAIAAAAPWPARADDTIRLRDLYNKDLSFSGYALEREGERVSISGYMAPPLKAESHFFVLTNRPLAVCPFCETEAQWPDDILAVYCKRVIEVISFNTRIVTRGKLELGTFTDPETGFVSRVRLADAVYERA